MKSTSNLTEYRVEMRPSYRRSFSYLSHFATAEEAQTHCSAMRDRARLIHSTTEFRVKTAKEPSK